jgi:uncharacterized protein YeaO (DUF488 family)
VPVRSKSIYEPAEPTDGWRILTTNYWPRGISKERAGTYKRVLAPSRPLLRAFKDGEIDWAAYEVRYREEMREAERLAEIASIALMARTDTVTVMCTCKDEAQCHRRLLRELIEQHLQVGAA